MLHIHINYLNFFEEPADPCEKELARKPFSLDHVHWIQYNYNKSIPNLTIDEADVAEKEMQIFKNQGGKTIVGMLIILLHHYTEIKQLLFFFDCRIKGPNYI